VIIDEKLKPWLLEINYTPSFTTDTPLDKVIKKGVVKESIEIMQI
jgi:tubulin polyglutamylase TTLL6/13